MKIFLFILIFCSVGCFNVYNKKIEKPIESIIIHDTIYIIDTIEKIVYKNISLPKIKKNKLEGFYNGKIDDMDINIAIFKYTGDHSYKFEFNATIAFNKYRGYVKEEIGNILKMNVNGEYAIWHINLINDTLIINQSGFPMFPTMNKIKLIKNNT